MSIADKITRLQAAKTAIGTAITAKGGTVAAGDGFEDFAADVGTIPSGSDANELVTRLTSNTLTISSNERKRIDVDFPNCTYYDTAQGGYPALDMSEIHYYFSDDITFLSGKIVPYLYVQHNDSNWKLYLHFSTRNIVKLGGWVGITGNCGCMLNGIYGEPLDFSSCTSDLSGTNFLWGDRYGYIDGVIHVFGSFYIRFVASTIKVNIGFPQVKGFETDSIISIANGLDGEISGKSLGLHANVKSDINSIIGRVSDGLFVQDQSGSVTLADFITNTKGWTIA